jgi:hypothetical protein
MLMAGSLLLASAGGLAWVTACTGADGLVGGRSKREPRMRAQRGREPCGREKRGLEFKGFLIEGPGSRARECISASSHLRDFI